MTSLTDTDSRESEATLSHASTLADSWIALEYRIHGGERNRALSVVKSRGSSHSNQVRELLLSDAGVDLADVYEYGSEVLMGTARVQKEHEIAEHHRRDLEREQQGDTEAGEKANRHRREIRRQRAADDEHDQNQGSQ